MVKVKLQQFVDDKRQEVKEVDLYFDGYIKSNLDIGLKQLHDDFDQVWFVDGGEGCGKSDLMAQLAFYVNKPDTRHTLIDRICTTAEAFDKAILNAEKFEAVVLDEAFGAMSATGSMAKVNKVLQRRFTEIRSKNLFIFIGAPSFMDIMRYFAIWRSKCLIHVYLGKERQRGFAAFFGEKKKRKLYIIGKKNFYNYSSVPAQFVFRFTKQMHKVVDKNLYDEKKVMIQSDSVEQERANKISRIKKDQGIFIIKKLLKTDPNMKKKDIAELFGVDPATITSYFKEINEDL